MTYIQTTTRSIGERDSLTHHPVYAVFLVTQGLELSSELASKPKATRRGKRHQNRVLHHSRSRLHPYFTPTYVGVAFAPSAPGFLKASKKDKIGGPGWVLAIKVPAFSRSSEGFGNKRGFVNQWKWKGRNRWTSFTSCDVMSVCAPKHSEQLHNLE